MSWWMPAATRELTCMDWQCRDKALVKAIVDRDVFLLNRIFGMVLMTDYLLAVPY
jgi:hypothetical protein